MHNPLNARVLPGWSDPAALFMQLEPQYADLFWLDAGANAVTGWSFLGTGTPAEGGYRDVRVDRPGAIDPEAPPFQGGWVGWCDYESGALAAGAPISGIPVGASWLRTDKVLAFDHTRQRMWALAAAHELDAWIAEITDGFIAPASAPAPASALAPASASAPASTPAPASALAPASAWVTASHITVARNTPNEYLDLIDRCRALIRAGQAYQLCLTTQFTVPGPHDAAATYRRLRKATPAHHGGFVRIGGRALLSASPEQFLHAGGGVIRTRPIKGTRPRSANPTDDAALAAELYNSPKERAENVMIVDLMRNDLSRVCEPGTIRVDGLWEVESYPAVHQLVSTVSGVAAHGTTVGELLAAAFPAGSMTGAPKLSAMTELHALEAGRRGIYAGCFGYVGVDGALDLAMVIRSIVIDGVSATVGAGGGITWGSVPEEEVAEVATKARAPLAALGAGLPDDWHPIS